MEASTVNQSGQYVQPQPLFPVYHLENPMRWPWEDIMRVLASRIVQKSVNHAHGLPLVAYSTWLDRIIQLGELVSNSDKGAADGTSAQQNPDALILPGLEQAMDASKAFSKKSNPAYDLADFFATDFRRMACGSVVLDTRLALEASPSLREFAKAANDAAFRDRLLEGYVDYWYRCNFLGS